MMDVLLVDGYNIIGASSYWKKLKKEDLSTARDELITKLANYGAYKGLRVIVVFDAHLVPGIEKKLNQSRIEVLFTKENETADECIEKLAISLRNKRYEIYVATSDFTEQWSVFGSGALRLSARELIEEMTDVDEQIEQSVKKLQKNKRNSKIPLSNEMAEIFEKWRRGDR
jgi:uncharacterized protein